MIVLHCSRPCGSVGHWKEVAMAVVTVGHHPELTAEQAMKLFQEHFAGKYEVSKFATGIRDFAIKQSNLVGVSVKLKQEKSKTSFLFTDFIPSFVMRILLAGIWFALLNRSAYEGMMSDVKAFIESAPEFK
jgi:hypothetical protein